MAVKLGDRLSYAGNLCTVRFIGSIPPWPSETALGVEWDDVVRGKHSGELNGVKYFDCSRPGAGSFIKMSKPRDETKSFAEAVKEKYGVAGGPAINDSSEQQPQATQWVGMTKKIEYIVDPLDIRRLHSISVDHSCVTHNNNDTGSGSSSTQDEGIYLDHITRLDLGFNLFTSLWQVKKLVERNGLSGLKELVLSGNRLALDLPEKWHGITELSLASTMVNDPKDLELLPSMFPDLKRLSLSSNELQGWDHGIWTNHPLDLLDLSFNQLESIDSITHVQELNISHNSINNLSNIHCISLNLSYNQLVDYRVLDSLNATNVELRDLKLTNNPININTGEERLFRIQAIARLSTIQRLNGTAITATERTDCEIYFMNNLVGDPESGFEQTPRYQQLVDIYGEPQSSKPQAGVQNGSTLKSKVISLNIHYENTCKQLKVLHTTTVAKLLLQASKLYKIPLSEAELQLEDGQPVSRVPGPSENLRLVRKSDL